MQITDRTKDVIKSGGEWIGSIDIENIAMAHPAVAMAACIGAKHPKWDERPLLVVVKKPGAELTQRGTAGLLRGQDRQVVDARRRGVRRRDPARRHRQDAEEQAARAVRRLQAADGLNPECRRTCPAPPRPTQARTLFPGVLACAVVAAAATFLSEHYGAPVMLFALLLGMAMNFLSGEGRASRASSSRAQGGAALSASRCSGLRITLGQVAELGWQPLLIVVLSVVLTIARVDGGGARLMGFQSLFGLLSGGATAICGASAALALAAALPNHPLKERATLFTVVGVSALSTLAMIVYPMIARAARPGRPGRRHLPRRDHPRRGAGGRRRLQHVARRPATSPRWSS